MDAAHGHASRRTGFGQTSAANLSSHSTLLIPGPAAADTAAAGKVRFIDRITFRTLGKDAIATLIVTGINAADGRPCISAATGTLEYTGSTGLSRAFSVGSGAALTVVGPVPTFASRRAASGR